MSIMISYSFLVSVVLFLVPLDLSRSRHVFCMPQNSDSSESSNVCETPGCTKAVDTILFNLDETIDPCDDFYKFACGGFISKRTIPEHRVKIDAFSDNAVAVNLKLKELFENDLDAPQPPFIQMAKDMYDSCMDLDSIENIKSQPLEKLLKDLGGWPVVEDNKWDESSFDWVDSLVEVKNAGCSSNMLIGMAVFTDSRNNTQHVIYLDQAPLFMPDRSYYLEGLNNSITAAYFKMQVQSAKLLGADESTAESELLKALEFEISLANISKANEERRDQSSMYNKYTVADLQNEVPQIPWLKLLDGLLKDDISETDTLIVRNPEYMRKFADLITSTEKRVIANFLMGSVVSHSIDFLSKDWRDIGREYSSAVGGENEEEPQWELCMDQTGTVLGIALSSYYVRKYFKEEDREAAMVIEDYVHKEFLDILDKLEWMDEETKKEAKAKATAIVPFIGYPEELLDDTVVMDYYEGLKITNDNYFDNILMYRKWKMDKEDSKLRKPVIKGEWKTYGLAAVVNAQYDLFENSIYFPAGILQDVFFQRERPNYLNFGSIGWIMGHEITHGFDDIGKQYDKDGSERNWWDASTDEHFRLKAQCVIDQYSNYTAENGMNINGVLTQGENIADIGGLKEAYRAYQSWTKDNGEEQLLPDLKYTQNQLFWISSASPYCTKYRPEVLKLSIDTDYHSPDPFRVIGSMSNLPEFSEDFNCPADSPMNRKNKCEVW